MKIYYLCFGHASVRSESLNYDPPIRNTVYIPKDLLTDEIMGNYVITNPNYDIVPIDLGELTYMSICLVAIDDVSKIPTFEEDRTK